MRSKKTTLQKHEHSSVLKNRKYLYKLIWLTCLCVSVPMLICGASIYSYIRRNQVADYYKESALELEIAVNKLDAIFEEVENTSFLLSSYYPVSAVANDEINQQNTILWRELLAHMTYEKMSNPYIDEIYYYNLSSNILLSDNYGYVPIHRYPQKEEFLNWSENRSTGWLNQAESFDGRHIVYVRQMAHVPGGDGYIIAKIKLSDVISVFQQRSKYASGSAYAIFLEDGDNDLVFSTVPMPEFFRTEDDGLSPQIDLDAAIQEINGKTYYSTTIESALSYRAVMMASEDIIFIMDSWNLTTIVLAFFLPLFVGLLLTLVCSFFMYRPINRLIYIGNSLISAKKKDGTQNEVDFLQSCFTDLKQQSDGLRQYIEKIKPDIVDSFLLKIIKGERTVSDTKFKQKCIENGIPVNARYTALVIGFEKGGALPEIPQMIEDIKTVGFAVENSSKWVVDTTNNTIAVIIAIESESFHDRLVSQVFVYANEIFYFFQQNYNILIHIGIARFCANFFEVATAYKEAKSALSYSVNQADEHLLFIADVEKWKMNSTLHYPYEQEKSIIQKLKAKNIHGACDGLDFFLESLQQNTSPVFVRQSLYLLLSNIIFSFSDKETKLLEFFKYNLFEQLEVFTSAKEIADWYKTEVFVLYLDLIEDVNEQNRIQMIDNIKNYIGQNVSYEISLAHCAELLGISPPYLSKMFKLQTGTNFVDYVTECRVNKAKNLLLETSGTISEISEQVGYSERSFYRAFFKMVGMSPNEFREHA